MDIKSSESRAFGFTCNKCGTKLYLSKVHEGNVKGNSTNKPATLASFSEVQEKEDTSRYHRAVEFAFYGTAIETSNHYSAISLPVCQMSPKGQSLLVM